MPRESPSPSTEPAIISSRTQVNHAHIKSIYPEVVSENMLDPKLSAPGEDTSKDVPPEEKDASPRSPVETVQPVEIFAAQPEVLKSPLALVNILAPVSHDFPEPKSKDTCMAPLPTSIKSRSEGKAIRQPSSAADAKLTEVIKTALVGAKLPADTDEHNLHHDVKGIASRAGTSSPNTSCLQEPTLAASNIHDTSAGAPLLKMDDEELEAKAKVVLKSLRDMGYVIQEPSPAKSLNSGSAASNKSEHLVVCQSCFKFKGRPCELKYVLLIRIWVVLILLRKHMKRHSRPYGCTFITCNKTFGSKNDWKRHENSQHFHLETWRCNEEKLEGGVCAKVCYRRQTFQEHLKKDHSITADDAVKNKLEVCRIGRNCQARFWCGFCSKILVLSKKGIHAWTERFDHIDDHFMGRHGQAKQNIRDWVPIDSDKPRGDLAHSLSTSPDNEINEGSSSASSSFCSASESSDAAGKSARALNPASHQESLKRKRSESSDVNRNIKKPMISYTGATIVYCVCFCNEFPTELY